jgi:hypothetical protein
MKLLTGNFLHLCVTFSVLGPNILLSTLISIKTNLMERGCEDGRWTELAQDRAQWWALVLAVLNLGVLLPQC